MKPTFSKKLLAIFLAFQISSLPQTVVASSVSGLITTQDAVEILSRTESESIVRAQLNRSEIQEELQKLGVSPEEVKMRMASLSDSELQDLAQQMQNAQYGGVIGILLVVVLILLIIYLAKRV